jgi:hypothetical protein
VLWCAEGFGSAVDILMPSSLAVAAESTDPVSRRPQGVAPESITLPNKSSIASCKKLISSAKKRPNALYELSQLVIVVVSMIIELQLVFFFLSESMGFAVVALVVALFL